MAARTDITRVRRRPRYHLHGPVTLFDARGRPLALQGRRLVALAERPHRPALPAAKRAA